MSTGVTLRPLGIGDILDRSFKLYTQNFVLCIAIYAVALVPIAVLQVLALVSANLGLYSAISIILAFASLLAYGALAHAASSRYLGRTVTIGEAYSVGLRRYLPMLGTSIIVIVLSVLPAFTVIGVVATIYLFIRWSLYAQASVVENAGVRGAMGRSSRLVGGQWWKVFLTGMLIMVLAGIVSYVVGLILGAIASAMGLMPSMTNFPLRPEAFFDEPEYFLLPRPASVVVNTLASLVSAPLIVIGYTVLYYDLRVRKEGYDLELMAQDLYKNQGGVTPE